MAVAPRTGPCSPWTSGPEIAALGPVVKAAAKMQVEQAALDLICAEAALAASQVLYELSGRMFTGDCGPVTVRPVSRPTDQDTRSSTPLGWFSVWGTASGYGAQPAGVLAHYGSVEPPTITLPYPVTEVLQVLIDGEVIPGPYDPVTQTGEWELRDFQELVRIRPTAASTPTQRWGWPTSQIMDLPDSEEGTFSVTVTFGTPPPAMGELAARKLGEYLALPQLGDTTHYPKRIVQMSRQGVSAQIASVIDILEKGSLGIWECDAFLLAVNPSKNQRQAAVYSPDTGRQARRQARPSLPS